MPRMTYPSVKDAASQILREIEADERIKKAELNILRDTQRNPKSDIAQGLMKIAEHCRNLKEDPEISYKDLQGFMETVNAKRTA